MAEPIHKRADDSSVAMNIDIKTRDGLFDMFLDDDFVPQAYVDILLSNVDIDNLNQVQTLSSGLLTRLDFYTRNLTNELEANIWSLEKLSEALPGTWSGSNSMDDLTIKEDKASDINQSTLWNSDISLASTHRSITGVSKLEYYLDTLGSSVKSLESDLNKVELELTESERTDDTNHKAKNKQVVENLRSLDLIKTRLSEVLAIFTTLKDILVISDPDIKPGNNTGEDQTFSIDDFRLSLSTLQDTIEQSLEQSIQQDILSTTNVELLWKIKHFARLTPVLKGLEKFYEEYQRFAETITQSSNKYLENGNTSG